MANHLIWLVLGLLLITVELMTGTFYLLVLGLGALIAAALGFLGGSFSAQALGASLVTVVGIVAVNRLRRNNNNAQPAMSDYIDFGQPVVFERWTNEAAGLARVSYRGTTWDAHVLGNSEPQATDVLYICGNNGGRLQVAVAKPR